MQEQRNIIKSQDNTQENTNQSQQQERDYSDVLLPLSVVENIVKVCSVPVGSNQIDMKTYKRNKAYSKKMIDDAIDDDMFCRGKVRKLKKLEKNGEIKEPKTYKTLNRIGSIGYTTIVTILVVLALLCFGGLPFGISAYGVASGSMEPNVPKSALVYVDTKQDVSEIVPGEIIAFDIGEDKVCTHRVVDKDESTHTFTTKGDANPANDAAPVPYDKVYGKALISIPFFGGLLLSIMNNKLIWGITIALITIVFVILSSIGKKTNKE